MPPELDTQEKIRKKIEELEKASGKVLNSAAMNIIEQYALGDERGKEEVMEKLDRAEEELNRSGQSAVSITDPEARFMKNKKERIELSYNYNSQITVDHDYGYFSGPNLRYREQKGLDGYIPDRKSGCPG